MIEMLAVRRVRSVVLLLVATAAGACGSSPPITPPAPTTTVAEGVIGDQGGVVAAAGGPRLTIPPGALDSPTTVRINAADGSGLARTEYRFEPDGQVFAKPITVELPVPAGTTAAFVYWADGSGGYEPIGGTVAGNLVRARAAHFSGGYAGEATLSRTVTGSSIVTNLTSSRIYNDPVDISGTTIAAYVPRPGGGYDVRPGQGHSDGTFRVPDVPVGPYLLKVGNRYVRTSEDVVDMGRVVPGRRGLVEVDLTTQQFMTVHYGLANLAPWGAPAPAPGAIGDRIDVFSVEANSWFWGAQGAVAPGATTLASTVNLLGASSKKVPVYALDASHGDRLVVAQQSPTTSTTGIRYQAMSRVFESAPISAAGGSSVDLVGALEDVAQARFVSVSWPFATWESAVVADANPRAVAYADQFTNRFRVVGQAGGLGYGTHELISKPDFLALPVGAGTPSLSSGRMSFGTPLSGDWGVHWIATADRAVPVQAGNVQGSFLISMRTMAALEGDVQLTGPQLGLPRSPKIGGQDLFTARAGVGLTPTLSWDVPSPGPADGYTVMIVQLVGTGNPPWRYLAFLDTAETSIELPPGILQGGSTYLAILRAYQRGVRVAAPLRIDLPLHQGIQVTETFTP